VQELKTKQEALAKHQVELEEQRLEQTRLVSNLKDLKVQGVQVCLCECGGIKAVPHCVGSPRSPSHVLQ
jgi:CDGSH-type Zn-finger protein